MNIFQQLIALIRKEPIVAVSLVGIVANTVVQVVQDHASIATAVQAAVIAIGALIARSQVTPTVKVNPPAQP